MSDTIFSDRDVLILQFDMATDRGRGSGGKDFVDSLFSMYSISVWLGALPRSLM